MKKYFNLIQVLSVIGIVMPMIVHAVTPEEEAAARFKQKQEVLFGIKDTEGLSAVQTLIGSFLGREENGLNAFLNTSSRCNAAAKDVSAPGEANPLMIARMARADL